MNDLWERLEKLLHSHAPSLLASFRSPASSAQIDEVERAIGATFPNDVRCAYLRHDGSSAGLAGSGKHTDLFVPFFRWCSLQEVHEMWRDKLEVMNVLKRESMRELSFPPEDDSWRDLAIRPEWWNPRWIPIARMDSTNYRLCADTRPGPSGRNGQLIITDEMGQGELLAPGLNHYLTTLCQRLESGMLAYTEQGWVEACSGEKIFDWPLLSDLPAERRQ